MPQRIEDYALIGDLQTAALVGRDGSIDWMCVPRFDSGACFAALLGTDDNGRWRIAPKDGATAQRRAYRDDTLVLDTEWETGSGVVTVTDFMPLRGQAPDIVRIVTGVRGQVPMRMELAVRFDYGQIVPWVTHANHGIIAIAGPDALRLTAPVPTRGEGFTTVAEFTVNRGTQAAFTLAWFPSHEEEPDEVEADVALRETAAWWRDWSSHCRYEGEWRNLVMRSLITLKALTFAPTGGIVAAATTSLPERIGGPRNWDYRYCWLRDATFTLLALINSGYTEEACAWGDWLLRAVAGDPGRTQIMYGLGGEHRLTEIELPGLAGYENSLPVRIGNAAHSQLQLDVYGEVCDALHQSRAAGIKPKDDGWRLQRALVRHVEKIWQQPDEGIWEVRGPRRHFTHSKVMAWVALDRAIKSAERWKLEAPLDRWKQVRLEIHECVCREGFDQQLGSFVQSFDSTLLDASLLMIPLSGFLPPDDPRVLGTIAAIEKHLCQDGFLRRYDTVATRDGLPPHEGVFLLCAFWLADCYALLGRRDEAKELFERLAGLCNDVGLLSEEYDPANRRMLGNFPQAFSHVGLINAATNLFKPAKCPSEQRSKT